jgi:DNA-binding GntR family transcriptional regulator
MRHRSSLTTQAYDAIKFDVITCAWQPGQQIAQHQLVEQYGFGTTPIREALQRLAQEGLVEPIPRFGYVVAQITLSDVREIYELRSILESAAARLAATRAKEQQLDQVAQTVHFTYVHGNRHTYSDFLARNAQFHRSIAALAGNERLAEQISRLLDEMTRIFHLGLDLRDSAEEMRNEHVVLARALGARNPDLAEQTVRDQIARSRERVLEALAGRSADVGYAILVEPANQA